MFEQEVQSSLRVYPHRASAAEAASAANASQWWRVGMGLGPILERHNVFQWDLAAAAADVWRAAWRSVGIA